jgi:predicted Rossmann-fold nucleotide-binding protein
VVLVGREYWARVFPVEFLVEQGFIGATDTGLCATVDTGDEAWQAIREFYEGRVTPEPGPLVDR